MLTAYRIALIRGWRSKVTKRSASSEVSVGIDHRIPLFLQPLVEILRLEQEVPHVYDVQPEPTPAPTEIGRAAAVHGAEMLRLGYTIDQVVHDYGDVCQSVTELAGEQIEPISIDEFRTLNRCLDDAIADAVAAYGAARQILINDQAGTLQERVTMFSDEQQRLVDIALQAYAAMNTGKVGLKESTGTVHIHA